MSKILRDYQCAYCGAVYESLDEEPSCKRCGERTEWGYLQRRLLSAPHLAYMKMGVDGSMSTAAEKWTKAHEAPEKSDKAQY